MNTRIYLKSRFNETGIIYVSDVRNFKKIALSECYDKYGQQCGHENAGDYSIYNNYCNELQEECLNELNKKFSTKYTDVRDVWVEDEHQEWVEAFEEKHGNYEMVLAHTYWDGNNWQSIIIKGDNFDDCVSHEIIEDEQLIQELDEALENMEEIADEYGIKKYKYNALLIEESRWAGDWEEYRIIL